MRKITVCLFLSQISQSRIMQSPTFRLCAGASRDDGVMVNVSAYREQEGVVLVSRQSTTGTRRDCALVNRRLCSTFVFTSISTFCYAERRRPELHTECYFAYPRQATSAEVVNANRTPRLRRAMQSAAGAKRTCLVASLSRSSQANDCLGRVFRSQSRLGISLRMRSSSCTTILGEDRM